jgi:hypothetical protein
MASLQELYAVSKAMGADKRAANPLASGMDAFSSGVSQGYGQDSGMERAYKIMQIKNAADQIKKRQEDMELKQMQFELTKKKTELDIASTQQEMENQSTLSKLYQQQQKGFSNTQGVDPKGIHTEQSKIAQMVDTEGRRTGEMARHYQDLPVREVGISDGKYKMTEKKKKDLPKPTQSGIQTTAIVDGQIVPVEPYNKEKASVNSETKKTLAILENAKSISEALNTIDEQEQFLISKGVDVDYLRNAAKQMFKKDSDFRTAANENKILQDLQTQNMTRSSQFVPYLQEKYGLSKQEVSDFIQELAKKNRIKLGTKKSWF